MFFVSVLNVSGFSQQTSVTEKQALVNKETKSELITKLSFSDEIAEKIIGIENEFHSSIAATNGMPETTEPEKKAKRAKVHDAHVIRREKLMSIPMTGRQMEDVIESAEAIRRKHKL